MTTVAMGTADPAAGTAVRWRDGKRYLWLLGLLVPVLPFGGWGMVALTGVGLFWWFGPLFLFVIIPVLDLLIGTDAANPPDSALAELERDRYYRWCTYAFLPLQFAALVWACWEWTRGGLSVVDSVGLAFTIGTVGGIAINTAHELGHKKESLERWLSRVALAPTGYGHFYIEHNRGHHVRVATPDDPASSRLGESFWAFLPRTVIGSLRSAWQIEAARLRRLGAGPWSRRNDILSAWAMTAALMAALVVAFGPRLLPYLAIQAVFGFSLLEVVNYVEHYGLARQKEPGGRWERVRPGHSWNSNNVATNVLLYHLQRHSDHHANPKRRYQALRHVDEAPQLPSGYASMIVLAYLPPVWRRVMDGRVLAHYNGDVSLASIHPPARQRVLARYGARGRVA